MISWMVIGIILGPSHNSGVYRHGIFPHKLFLCPEIVA